MLFSKPTNFVIVPNTYRPIANNWGTLNVSEKCGLCLSSVEWDVFEGQNIRILNENSLLSKKHERKLSILHHVVGVKL